MFRSKKKADSTQQSRKVLPTVIASDVNILGNIISDGVVDIDGCIEGNVKAHRIIVRKDGVIKGDLHADEVQIHGIVKGLVKAKDVHLTETCHVEGSIMHEILSIEDGANVDGQFKRAVRGDKGLDHEPQVLKGAADEGEGDEEEIRLLENIRLISNRDE